MKVKGTGSRCLLEECVKGYYYARFHTSSYHCYREKHLDMNCGRTDERTNGRTNGRKVEPLYRTLLKAGAIKTDWKFSFKSSLEGLNSRTIWGLIFSTDWKFYINNRIELCSRTDKEIYFFFFFGGGGVISRTGLIEQLTSTQCSLPFTTNWQLVKGYVNPENWQEHQVLNSLFPLCRLPISSTPISSILT